MLIVIIASYNILNFVGLFFLASVINGFGAYGRMLLVIWKD